MGALMRRVVALACGMLLAVSPALADAVQFRLTADIDPVQYPEAVRPLMEGLADLADAGSIEGTWQSADGRFRLDAALLLPHRESVQRTEGRLWGIDSHFAVETTLLGDTPLMLNNLALAEFGVKAYNHLGVPLQYAALAVPYVHTSAVDALLPAVAVLFPSEPGETLLSAEELHDTAARAAELCQTDRTLRCWIEAMGIESGADWIIFDALSALPDALAALCPEGMRVVRTETSLTWAPAGEGADSLLEWAVEDRTTRLTAALPGLCSINMSLRDDLTILTGTLHIESPVAAIETAFSLPTALPVTLPFFLTVEAEGLILGEPVQLAFDGEAHGNMLTIRQLLPDHSRTMATITLTLAPVASAPLPEWSAADVQGVNILSATSETLGDLMHTVRRPLATGLFDLVSALPPATCQAMMDLLDDSGILALLTDAMMGSGAAY